MKPSDLTPPGFCECGCGLTPAPARSSWAEKGRIKGQPLRFVKGHGGHSGARPPIEVVDGCWVWRGKINAAGYGLVRRGGRDWLAHRWVYSRLVRPLFVSDVLDHLCRNPACVNPEHLEPTTDAENVRRGRCATLTPDNVKHIRNEWMLARHSMTQREFARRAAPLFFVAEDTIRNLLLGRTWAEPKLRETA